MLEILPAAGGSIGPTTEKAAVPGCRRVAKIQGPAGKSKAQSQLLDNFHNRQVDLFPHLEIFRPRSTVGKIIEKDFQKVSPDDKLEELIDIISKSRRNIFPVLNKDNMLIGIVYLDNIRHIIFNPEMYSTTFVRDVMLLPPTYISPDEPMEDVMKKFEENNVWNLPVIDNGKYIGFISKSKLFSVYRKWLVDISEE